MGDHEVGDCVDRLMKFQLGTVLLKYLGNNVMLRHKFEYK